MQLNYGKIKTEYSEWQEEAEVVCKQCTKDRFTLIRSKESCAAEEFKSKLGKAKMQTRVLPIEPPFKNEGTDIPR